MQDRRTGQRQEQKVKCGIECPGEPTESFPWREQGLDPAMPGLYPVPAADTRDVLKSPVPQVTPAQQKHFKDHVWLKEKWLVSL